VLPTSTDESSADPNLSKYCNILLECTCRHRAAVRRQYTVSATPPRPFTTTVIYSVVSHDSNFLLIMLNNFFLSSSLSCCSSLPLVSTRQRALSTSSPLIACSSSCLDKKIQFHSHSVLLPCLQSVSVWLADECG